MQKKSVYVLKIEALILSRIIFAIDLIFITYIYAEMIALTCKNTKPLLSKALKKVDNKLVK